MLFRAILVSADAGAVRVLTRVLRDLGIEAEPCPHVAEATKLLARRSFDAIIVDVDEGPAAVSLLEGTNQSSASKRALGIALSRSRGAGQSPPQGAHIVLYKPISVERVTQGLRAIKNLLARDRRSGAVRIPVEVPASIIGQDIGTVEVTLVDLSEGGAAIRHTTPLQTTGLLTLECQLPQTTALMKATAEVVWRDVKNQFGVRFTNLPLGSRMILASWLKENEHRAQTSYRGRAAGR